MTTRHTLVGDYATGDHCDQRGEPADGAIVLARYLSGGYGDRREFEKVWRRDDEGAGDSAAYGSRWFEIRTPSAHCKTCRATSELGSTGPDSWGVVLGLDDPEPYGLGQVVLWSGGDMYLDF